MSKIRDHFIKEYNQIYGDNDEKFLKQEGRERFVTYVSAIINGKKSLSQTYENGKLVCKAVFKQRYTVKEIRAVENIVELTLEGMTVPMIQSIGE